MKHLSMDMTLKELINNPYLADELKYLIDDSILEKVPKAFRKVKLKTVVKLAPMLNWDDILEVGNALIDKKIAEGSLHIPLAHNDAVLFPFELDKTSPAVLVCPGGGYKVVASAVEGFPIAFALNKAGYSAYVLNYRHGDAARFPAPMEDVAQAISYIRGDGDRKISLWGSSAGGHLCAYFGARWMDFGQDTRPDSLVLSYPVITMEKGTHKESRDLLLGPDATKQKISAKSVQNLVTDEYPPTFIWHCTDDSTVDASANSGALADSLLAKGVKHVLRLYPQGGHGSALAKGTSAEGWFEEALDFMVEAHII